MSDPGKFTFWQFLFELLSGMFTDQRMRQAGAAPGTPAAKIAVGLPSGFNATAEENRQRSAVVAFMRSQKGKSYRLGAEVSAGHEYEAAEWDCSEETESAFRVAGLNLPDGARFQYDFCRPVRDPQAGDLGFLWSTRRGCIGHVMVYTGDHTVVHAVLGRGVVEDPSLKWTTDPRWRGWRRHPHWSRPPEDRV